MATSTEFIYLQLKLPCLAFPKAEHFFVVNIVTALIRALQNDFRFLGKSNFFSKGIICPWPLVTSLNLSTVYQHYISMLFIKSAKSFNKHSCNWVSIIQQSWWIVLPVVGCSCQNCGKLRTALKEARKGFSLL